jgi:hypothetical protein
MAIPSTSRWAADWQERRENRGEFVLHGVPRNGFAFSGHQLAAHAFRVARIRWTWELQRPRFRAAAVSGPLPDLGHHQSGARLPEVLPPNNARDVDLVISYGKPYWPDSRGSLRDNARLGPLPNDSGLWLTATSYHRPQAQYPALKSCARVSRSRARNPTGLRAADWAPTEPTTCTGS